MFKKVEIEQKRRAMFAAFPSISDERKDQFEKEAGMKITRPLPYAQAIRKKFGLKPLPILFTPLKVG